LVSPPPAAAEIPGLPLLCAHEYPPPPQAAEIPGFVIVKKGKELFLKKNGKGVQGGISRFYPGGFYEYY
jgi:hypothetical protein